MDKIDPRILPVQQQRAIVLAEMRAKLEESRRKTVWCTSAGDLARWIQILAGERIWPTDMSGEPYTLCHECQNVVHSVYVLPRPKWGICGLCCNHKKERDIYGSCSVCVKK